MSKFFVLLITMITLLFSLNFISCSDDDETQDGCIQVQEGTWVVNFEMMGFSGYCELQQDECVLTLVLNDVTFSGELSGSYYEGSAEMNSGTWKMMVTFEGNPADKFSGETRMYLNSGNIAPDIVRGEFYSP